MKKLTKEEEQELAWRWHLDKSLSLVYGTFDNYVKVVTNISNTSDLNSTINTPIGG